MGKTVMIDYFEMSNFVPDIQVLQNMQISQVITS